MEDNEKTLKDLQAEVVTLGMPKEDALKFTVKSTLQSTINTLKASKSVSKVESLDIVEDARTTKKDEKIWMNKAMVMRDQLDKQPKVRIRLPCDIKEKPGVVEQVMIKGRKEWKHISGAIETVTLNGYKFIIPKGVYFDVPQQIADVLDESNVATQEAGKNILADRIDEKTGKPVMDQL